MRGVYLKDDIERGTVIVKIPKKLIMSCDMGIDCELSQGLQPGRDSFEKFKHIYFANFLLEDMEDEDSFFKPYYDTLPEDINNIPIIWSNKEINRLHGSYFVYPLHLLINSPSAFAPELFRFTAVIRKCVM